jgi:hypothetical protein
MLLWTTLLVVPSFFTFGHHLQQNSLTFCLLQLVSFLPHDSYCPAVLILFPKFLLLVFYIRRASTTSLKVHDSSIESCHEHFGRGSLCHWLLGFLENKSGVRCSIATSPKPMSGHCKSCSSKILLEIFHCPSQLIPFAVKRQIGVL